MNLVGLILQPLTESLKMWEFYNPQDNQPQCLTLLLLESCCYWPYFVCITEVYALFSSAKIDVEKDVFPLPL